MNRFIKAAIQNMEMVENGDVAYTPKDKDRLTKEAIAYSLIAIAEHLDTDAMERLDAYEGAVQTALGMHEQEYHR